MQVVGFWGKGVRFQVSGSGPPPMAGECCFGVEGLGLWGFGVRGFVRGFMFRVEGFEFRY